MEMNPLYLVMGTVCLGAITGVCRLLSLIILPIFQNVGYLTVKYAADGIKCTDP